MNDASDNILKKLWVKHKQFNLLKTKNQLMVLKIITGPSTICCTLYVHPYSCGPSLPHQSISLTKDVQEHLNNETSFYREQKRIIKVKNS